MILHLVSDEKVVSRMISQFEEINPNNNIYICVTTIEDKKNLLYLADNPYVLLSQSTESSNIPWEKINKVCFHYLSFLKIRYYLKIRYKHNLQNAKNIWFMWGGDIYDEILVRRGFELYTEDNSYRREINKKTNYGISIRNVSSKIRREFRYLISDRFFLYFYDKLADYIVCNSKYEFELFCKYVKFSHCRELLRYHYYPIEDTLGSLINMRTHGNSIIVGNSASPTNNHEYLLSLLKELPLEDRKVYVPLGYSREEPYVSIINDKFSTLSNAVLLNDFVPLDEYHKILADCSTFVYGNIRQEAWGNILVALYLGGKVYISEKSILAKGLESSGYTFFITEKISETFQIELTKEEKEKNREIALKKCSKEINMKNIKYLCNL